MSSREEEPTQEELSTVAAQDQTEKTVETLVKDPDFRSGSSPEAKYQSPALAHINKLLAKGIHGPVVIDTEEDDAPEPQSDEESDKVADERGESAKPKLTDLERQQEILKQSLNRTLACYCRIKDHTKEHPKDFNDSEVEAITEMTTQLLQQVFPTQLATDMEVQNYLIIYYKIHKLKQMEHRRNTFLDEFSDVIEIDEQTNRFFQSSALTLAKGVRDTAAALDQIVAPRVKSKSLRRR